MMKKKISSLALIVALSFLAACAQSSSKQQAATDEAMKALRKIAAGTDVGINYQEYGPLVIDAQALVNDASVLLPDGELKREMNAAMEAYGDARLVWSDEIQNSDPDYPPRLYLDFGPGKTLIPKYSIETTNRGQVSSAYAIKAIWQIGRTHLNNASAQREK